MVPRLLALYRPTDDSPDKAPPIAWALVRHDGTTVTMPVSTTKTVTMWSSLKEAEEELDAFAKPVTLKDVEAWGVSA